MARRLTVLAIVAVAVVSALGVLAQDNPPATPDTVSASPGASPAASPAASPIGTPVQMAGDVEAGKTLAMQCIGCHTIDGSTLVGPSWKGIYGSTVELEDGTTVVVDDAYLYQAITDPMSQIVKGFVPAMPPYNWLTPEQIADLIAYIKSLK